MYGCMDGWMDGWIDGWIDECVYVCIHQVNQNKFFGKLFLIKGSLQVPQLFFPSLNSCIARSTQMMWSYLIWYI